MAFVRTNAPFRVGCSCLVDAAAFRDTVLLAGIEGDDEVGVVLKSHWFASERRFL